MRCMVELVSYPDTCTVLVVRGEFDETINAFATTNILVIAPGINDAVVALMS